MVLESFCGHSFWDPDVSYNGPYPIFSPCLSDTALLWAPSLMLLISSPFIISSTLKLRQPSSPWSFLSLILCLIICLASLVEIILSLSKLTAGQSIYPVEYVAPIIKLSTFALATGLLLLYQRKGVNSSGVLFIFWLLISISLGINYWTVIDAIREPVSQTAACTESPLVYQNTVVERCCSPHQTLLVRVWSFDHGVLWTRSFEVLSAVCLCFLYCFADSRKDKVEGEFQKQCPLVRSSFLSRITFCWYDSLAYLGFKRALTQNDVWDLQEENKTVTILEGFTKHLQSATKYVYESRYTPGSEAGIKAKPRMKINMLFLLFRAFWPNLLLAGTFMFFGCILIFANPTLLDYLITFVASKEPAWKGYILVLGMFLSSFLHSVLDNYYDFIIQTTSMQMRSALIASIYTKSLRLSSLGRKDFTTGEIVNMMAVDTQRIVDYINIYNILWSAPVQLCVSIYLLWRQLGVASLSVVIYMALLIPFNGFITTNIKNIQKEVMKQKDDRAKMMSEILNGMKVLKLYAWEGAFSDIVTGYRNIEVGHLKHQAFYNSGVAFAFACSPFIMSLACLSTYVLMDSSNVLDANKAFVSLSLINIFARPLAFLPMVLTFGANFLISIKRINRYLQADELDLNVVGHEENTEKPIIVQNASFSWSREEEPVLRSIDIEVKAEKLIAVVGTVGSGKSSLLSALLGDLYKKDGFVNLSGKCAYVPQTAWMQNATVRQNILFGQSYNKDRYDRTIEACALTPDMKVLTGGDLTEIGERGINVSGGQKQRISLARAVYSNSDVYLFDDPLSAVDAHVAKHLFENVIGPKGLLQHKTRILVTHRITFLPEVDEIIVLRDGKIFEQGSYADLMAKKGEFSDLIIQYLAEIEGNDEHHEDPSVIEMMKEKVKPQLEKRISLNRTISGDSTSGSRKRTSTQQSLGKKLSQTQAEIEALKAEEEKFELVESESAETGSVKFKVYLDYFKAVGPIACSMTVLAYMLASSMNFSTNLWLSAWSDDSLDPANANDTSLRNKRLGVYAALGFSESVFILSFSIITNLNVLNGAKWIHKKMIYRITRAPMSFFDTTPLGRILNRFTKDIDTADITIGFNFRQLVSQFFRTLVSIVVISFETPFILMPIILIGIVYFFIQKFYIASSRQLKRIESITRSPIYSHFSETVTGSTSIRAYNASDRFIAECYQRVDTNHTAYFPELVANRWIGMRLEFLGNCIVTLAAVFAVASRGSLSPGTTGLSVSYALNVTLVLNLLIRAVSDVETNIVAIERCLEYSKTPMEASWINPFHRPKDDWPEKGQIVFKKYSTRYREGLDLVLRDISCTINPNEKVGIVGRTGAGKSSLTLALFRLIEPVDGTISIDSEDVTKMGLHDLRSRLTVIPQDPVLFSGSFRRNFDPFHLHTDAEIWKALAQANLKGFVETLERGLNHPIAEGGENLSVGQRQLVCLARALLRKSKILILDEATAAVDVETDELIQATIRREFKDCSIVTIAHRLNTIMDYDKIIVMDKGQIIEYDTPDSLLKNHDSVFHSMAKEAKLV